MWKYPYKTKPYGHQRDALNLSANQTNYALFMEMGTGKTKTTIDNIAYLNLTKNLKAALITDSGSPANVITVRFVAFPGSTSSNVTPSEFLISFTTF